MIIWNILSLVLWLLLMPFCMGLLLLPLFKKQLRTPGAAWIAGYILVFTLLEAVGIPIVLTVTYSGFSTFSNWFTAALVLCAAAGIAVALKGRKKGYELSFDIRAGFCESSLETKIMLLLFVLLVGFQLYMAFTRASFDGDDAYYNVQALIAQQLDTLYRINPNTGRSAPLDVRHALALFPIWEAYIGRMSGIHAAVICHSIVPLILIPLTYTVYWQIGKSLLKRKKELLPMFMVLMALWQMFGNISIYTTETFFLTRTWQGKSVAGNFVIPAVLWIFLCLFDQEEDGNGGQKGIAETAKNTGLWLLLLFLNFAGGASSSLAVLLSLLLTAGLALLFAWKEKRFDILIKAGICCLLGGAYVLLYLLLTHGIIQL